MKPSRTVSKLCPIALIGGGALSQNTVSLVRRFDPKWIAADGGADQALAFGLMLEAVYGDFDSLSKAALGEIPGERLHHIAEQDSTDFEKALRECDAPFVLAIGFGGGRMDHFLAVLNCLVRYPQKRCFVLTDEEIIFLCPPQLALPLDPETRVSLFPMGDAIAQSKGLFWPVDGLKMAPDGRIGTSNKATGAITLTSKLPNLLVMLPIATLDTVVAQIWHGWSETPD